MTPFGRPAEFRLELEVQPPVSLDPAGDGPVRLVVIGGGRVAGAITGRVLPGGTDWQTIMNDGTVSIEARYLLQLDDGARIDLQSRGQRAAGASGFWSSIWLRTTDPRHRALTGRHYLGLGRKREGHVEIAAFAFPDPVSDD